MKGRLNRPADTSGTIWASGGILSDISQQIINSQRSAYNSDKNYYRLVDDVQYAIFLIDSNTGIAVSNPNIGKLGVMNSLEEKNKTILRKVDSNYNPLYGATKYTDMIEL